MHISLLLLAWISLAAGGVLASVVATARRRGFEHDGYEQVLLVGTSTLTAQLVRELASRSWPHWRIVGVVADPPEGPPVAGPWLGPLSSLAEILERTRAKRVVVAPADRRRVEVQTTLVDARLRGVIVEDPMQAIEDATGKLPIEQITQRSLMLSDGFRHSDLAPSDSTRLATRAMSTAVAAGALVVSAPFLALIALAIVTDSPGPVFFVQERVGVGARPFRLIKFRTMHDRGPHASEWVRDNANRITRVGRILRRFRLDEWPQFVNVLRGEMALVGPRPQPVSNCALFMRSIPHYRLRCAVLPGITGWAQVRYGYANSLEEETEKMRYDLYYIKHRSLWLDLRILVETAGMLIFDGRSHLGTRASASPPAARSAYPRAVRGARAS